MALSLDGTTGISASGNITGGNIVVSGTLTAGTFAPTVFSTTGNVTGGNVLSTGPISAAGNVTGLYVIGDGSQLTGLPAGYTNANLATLGSNAISTTGTITGGNITGNNLTVTTGTITGGNIVNGNGNGVGNIGSSTTYFNTVFAKATSAQYADLAEMYCADNMYDPGTVVEFGGTDEITISKESHSTRVAGIISTNPSYLMNSTLTCTNALEVALVGRVPCHVVGTIQKGDRLVASDIAGVATAMTLADYQPGCIIGKALEAYNSETVGTIEVAVGRI